ncbi:MAG: hypothetical protein WDN00_19380 [Limisphaerales bacterium]
MNAFDKFGVAGRIADFDERNGGNSVYFNGCFLYANGATRDGDPLGALIDPPENEDRLLANLLQYHKARHAIAVREFDNLKEELACSGCPQPEGLDQLRRLREVVSQRNQAVNDAQAKVDNTETGKRLAMLRQLDAENKQQLAEYRDDLKKLRI